MKNLTDYILTQLARILIQANIIAPILSALQGQGGGGGLLGAIGGLFGGGGAASGGAIESGAADAALSMATFAAGGADASAGQPFIVGERGPELFIPNTSGFIVPNNQMGGQVFNVDMRGASVEAVSRLERFVYQINQSVEPRAIRAVSDSNRRR